MSTLATMKTRIADELARSDLTSQIAYAISDAIKAYQDEEFDTSDRRFSFSTVASQEFYSSADSAYIPLIEKIDWVKIYISDAPSDVHAMTSSAIESASSNGIMLGDPTGYCFMPEAGTRAIRLYPVPVSIRTVRVLAKVRPAEPADDAEASNFWMTEAERLIRGRAKYELYKHVIRNNEAADELVAGIKDAFDQLKNRYLRRSRTGDYIVAPMDF